MWPASCDGCGDSPTFSHALDCKKGGLVIQRQNEIRDALEDLVAMGFKEVVREPIVKEADDTVDSPALIADLSARGVWQPQTVALLDVRVVDNDAQSYSSRPVSAILSSAELEKKNKYTAAAESRRASFTPFVVSVDGVFGCEATCFLKRVAERLSFIWNKPYSNVMGWAKVRLHFAIIRATNLCLRGSRTKWRSISQMMDGCGLPNTLCNI